MSTAMSTKRSFIPVQEASQSKLNLPALVALLAGAVFLAFGIKLDSSPLAIVGFVAFTSSMLYFNSIFWAHVMRNTKIDPARVSQIRKYY